MLSNFISGGQVFLHKVRMFKQIAVTGLLLSLIFGMLGSSIYYFPKFRSHDFPAIITYLKAKSSIAFYKEINKYRQEKKRKNKISIDAYDKGGLYRKNMRALSVLKSRKFASSYNRFILTIAGSGKLAFYLSSGFLLILFLLWSKFGKFIKEDRNSDDQKVLSSEEVSSWLRTHKRASKIIIGNMPLVKRSETQHLLVTGSTGCGKTNLIHNILRAAEKNNQPAFIIDQTGEMIAEYYNKERGDIIFNPFDARRTAWDFWKDCGARDHDSNQINVRLEKFAKILFSFNRRQASSISSDPFWENSAEVIFTSCAQYLIENNNLDLAELKQMVTSDSAKILQDKLKSTAAARYLDNSNKNTASSILSVLSTATRPLSYLKDEENKFSLLEYFSGIRNGKNNWIFLSSPPGQRELTMPLIACLTDLSMSFLMEHGQSSRKTWFVLDELASLGKLPALNGLMNESRKYGGCVIAGMQSANQLYDIYGFNGGMSIFSQFGTKFFFRTHDPNIAKLITEISGTSKIIKQQKNISFGASNFRDGVSYTEQERREPLIEFKDLAKLKIGQCYCLLPEPEVRISKLQVPKIKLKGKNKSFISAKIINANQTKKNNGKKDGDKAIQSNEINEIEHLSIM